MDREPLLAVRDLVTEFRTEGGVMRAVDGISLSVEEGETIGVVGESGSGKSVTALSVLGLVPDPPGRVAGGEITFKGLDLLTVDEERMRQIRGNEIAMVFQEPMSALNPVLPVGEQVGESVRVHRGLNARAARQQVIDLLQQVGIPSPQQCYASYPHQLSGGMRQRVMLAMALICEPDLLIADEPTSALDVTLQAQILELLRRLAQSRSTMAILLISHDLSLVAEVCDRVFVLYAGQVVEEASVRDCFAVPAHPYTGALLRSIQSFDTGRGRLAELPGAPPALRRGWAEGCRFSPRCDRARPQCDRTPPALDEIGAGRKVRCLYPLTGSIGQEHE